MDEFGGMPLVTECDVPIPRPSRGMHDGSRTRLYHRGVDSSHPV